MVFTVMISMWLSQITTWLVIYHLYRKGTKGESPSVKLIERCAIAAFIALAIASVTLSGIASECAMFNIPI